MPEFINAPFQPQKSKPRVMLFYLCLTISKGLIPQGGNHRGYFRRSKVRLQENFFGQSGHIFFLVKEQIATRQVFLASRVESKKAWTQEATRQNQPTKQSRRSRHHDPRTILTITKRPTQSESGTSNSRSKSNTVHSQKLCNKKAPERNAQRCKLFRRVDPKSTKSKTQKQTKREKKNSEANQ